MAISDVRLLRIPMYLLRQQNVANIWLRIKQFLDSRIPTNDELFQRFVEEKEWIRYRRTFCDSLRRKQIPNNTTIHDTPYYWRVKKMEWDEVGAEDRSRNTKGRLLKKSCKKATDLPRLSDNEVKERTLIHVPSGGNLERSDTRVVNDLSQSGSSKRVTVDLSHADSPGLENQPADNVELSDTITL